MGCVERDLDINIQIINRLLANYSVREMVEIKPVKVANQVPDRTDI